MPSQDEQIPQYRYGDHPELFWELQPDAPIDLSRPSIIARILKDGSLPTIRKLIPVSVLRRELPTLPIPEHTRRFWSRVVELIDEKQDEQPSSRQGA